MAQITNIYNSADSTPMISSTTPSDSDDDVDERHQFLTPISEINSKEINNGVVPPHTVVKMNDNDNNSDNIDVLSYANQPPTTTATFTNNSTNSQLQIYLNLSTSSSEISLDRPLLNPQYQTSSVHPILIENEDERVQSSTVSTSSSSSNAQSFRTYMTLYLTDMLISAFIITPLVNIHWRGAWDLLDIHLLPDYPRISAIISLCIGYLMLYMMYLTQYYIQNYYERHRHTITGTIMTRLYTLLLALAYIQEWRGLWNLLDLTSNEWYYLTAETGVCIVFLLLMKSVYNLNSAPFIIGIDTESYFLLDSKYTITTNSFLQHTFDFFYYEIVEAPLLIVTWHGLYNLSDSYIYPDNRQLSMIISFASGYILYFLLSLLQVPIVRCLLKQHNEMLHAFVSTIFHLLAFVSVVQIWRSLWVICEQYLNIPEYHNTTLILCYGLAFVVLTCGLAACSLNGPGGSKDSYVTEGPILIFKFDYFSSLLKQHHTDETIPSQASSHSGIILWLVVHVLRRQEQRRNTLLNQSRRSSLLSQSRRSSLLSQSRRSTLLNQSRTNSILDVDVPPTISETMIVN